MLFLAFLPLCSAILFDIFPQSQPITRCFYETFSKDTTITGKISPLVMQGNVQLDVLIEDDTETLPSRYFSKVGLKTAQDFKFVTTKWYEPIKFCFTATNNGGTNSMISIEFTMDTHLETSYEHSNRVTSEQLKPNEMELWRLLDITAGIKQEMTYLEEREKQMRDLNEATNERIRNFRLLSLIFFFMVGAGQIAYLQRFFKQKVPF